MPRNKTLLTPIILLGSLTGAVFAQSPLSTIQDVLFKADGARFTGSLVIHWSTFDANNLGTVIQQSKTVSVLNGNLQLELAPNATAQSPANTYSVSYQADGREQFTETWVVPASSFPLTVAQVRVGSASSGGGIDSTASAGNTTPILESSIIGLLADLGQRPTRGPGFGTGAVAVINQNGQLETAVGSLGDCVFVDGTTGPCGAAVPVFVDAEVPGGTIDGANTAFTLQNPPSGSSLMLYRNGVHLIAGADYTLTGTALAFINNAQPQPGDTLTASYRVDVGRVDAGNIGASHSPPGATITQIICITSGRSTNATTLSSLGGCDIPATSIRPGDRFEIRFNFSKPGTDAAYDVAINWGSVNALTRHATAQDTAFIGRTEAAITPAGAQISVESWGLTLPFLPGIVNAGLQNGIHIDFLGKLSAPSADTLSLTNFTVLRYPAN